jgi:excisionase family DNA binding protein
MKNQHTVCIRSVPPRVLNVKEASAYLSISERKLREEIALGNIKVARLGRRILLRLSDLDEFVASLTV